MAKPLTFIVIVLQIGGLVLLSALLVTPAQRHPIVNGIVVLSIAHCVIGILPALLYLSNSGFRIASKEHFQYDEGWARLCATDSVLLNYVTTAKSAFAISFTMVSPHGPCHIAASLRGVKPCVYLACKFTGNRDRLEAQATPHFYKRTVIALCVGPYLWALPLIFLTIHKLQQPLSMQPHFIGSICVVVYNTGQILALLLTLIPLTLAVVASIVLAFILFKYYKLPHLRQSFMLLHPIRIVRFASLVATIVVSAVLYAIVLATWVRYDSVHDLKSETAFRAWLKTSAVWEFPTWQLDHSGAPGTAVHSTQNLPPRRQEQRAMADHQIEKAYQKQYLFQNAKARGTKKVSTKEKRWYKDVGLGFKTPAEAINGTYIDKKCPFTGDVSIRGRILTGRVISTKMTRTLIIRRDYLHYIPKYNRYEKRHKNLAAHVSPAFRVEPGDIVTVGQCRPLSKTVRFNVVRVAKNKAAAKSFGKF
ncbi:hypothetical protein EVJ58_g3557 [Rhodofomes roseus]|uniref:Small ribosomal subunit protein uS17 N-terminal domain-containing protein n=2 Tax=Rhodofomes roseus TaxID=34475 RepID=A0A4Y9YM73_9APHY|nr:hypothetical protein EVJ58_g3557 [Rhodofomes roseus]